MRILVVVDMQKDFVDGSLGTKEAQAIVPAVVKKIQEYKEDCIFVTFDTHEKDYLKTAEGQKLPVEHCIRGTAGHELSEPVADALKDCLRVISIEKPTFGSLELVEKVKDCINTEKVESIELIGLCTDICVVSNALLLKANFYEIPISVDASCCAGVTIESHEAALKTMSMCQIDIKE